MKKNWGLFLAACFAPVCMSCGTFLIIGPKGIGLPETKPEGSAEYCLFVSSKVLEESREAIKGTGFGGIAADPKLNLYSRNIFWVLDYSSDNFDDIKRRLSEIGLDSPIISAPEGLPYFKGSDDGTRACYVKKY